MFDKSGLVISFFFKMGIRIRSEPDQIRNTVSNKKYFKKLWFNQMTAHLAKGYMENWKTDDKIKI